MKCEGCGEKWEGRGRRERIEEESGMCVVRKWDE